MTTDENAAPQGQREHELKCWPEYFSAIEDGSKTFEIRRDDRVPRFEVGHVLHLREWSPLTDRYTGRGMFREVSYVTTYAQQPGYVVMGLRAPTQEEGERKTPTLDVGEHEGSKISGWGDGDLSLHTVPTPPSAEERIDGYVTSERVLRDGGRELIVLTRDPWGGDVPVTLNVVRGSEPGAEVGLEAIISGVLGKRLHYLTERARADTTAMLLAALRTKGGTE